MQATSSPDTFACAELSEKPTEAATCRDCQCFQDVQGFCICAVEMMTGWFEGCKLYRAEPTNEVCEDAQ